MSRPIVLGELYQTPIQESSAGIGCLRFCGRSICSVERSWLKEKGACMDTALTGLFDRIREKCRRDSWYGGKLDLRLARSDHPQRRGFTYPPASEEQLRATEAALGFPLPPFLRALYAEVANGCFGPGGYGSCTDEPDSTIVVDYAWHCQIGYAHMGRRERVWLVDLAGYQWRRRKTSEYLLLPYETWPGQLLSLEVLGCCMKVCLDCKTGRMLCIAPSANDKKYEVGLVAPTLRDYSERWLNGEVVP